MSVCGYLVCEPPCSCNSYLIKYNSTCVAIGYLASTSEPLNLDLIAPSI